MEVKLGKWEKGDIQRIYFNADALGNSKVYAYPNKDGLFALGSQTYSVPGKSRLISDVQNAGVELIEKLIGKPINYDTKFSDIWSAL